MPQRAGQRPVWCRMGLPLEGLPSAGDDRAVGVDGESGKTFLRKQHLK